MPKCYPLAATLSWLILSHSRKNAVTQYVRTLGPIDVIYKYINLGNERIDNVHVHLDRTCITFYISSVELIM